MGSWLGMVWDDLDGMMQGKEEESMPVDGI